MVVVEVAESCGEHVAFSTGCRSFELPGSVCRRVGLVRECGVLVATALLLVRLDIAVELREDLLPRAVSTLACHYV